MTPVLLDVDGAALKVVSFLAAKDVLRLHPASRDWHSFLGAQEERIFRGFLLRDFPAEGSLLVHYVAETKGVPCRKLYLAFYKRRILKLPRDFSYSNFPNSTNVKERVCVPWIRPDWREYIRPPDLEWLKRKREREMDRPRYYHRVPDLLDGYPCILKVLDGSINESGGRSQSSKGDGGEGRGVDEGLASLDSIVKFADASQVAEEFGLVFIGRMGNFDDPWTCLPLKMECKGCDTPSEAQALVADEEAMMQVPELADYYCPNNVGLIDLPLAERMSDLLQNAWGYEGWHKEFTDVFREEYPLILHVINLHTCQVLTLPVECGDRDVSLCEEKRVLIPEYSWSEVYGVPPRYSPKYKKALNQRDFFRSMEYRYGGEGYPPPPFGQLSVQGQIHSLYIRDERDSTVEPYLMGNIGEQLPFFHLGGYFSDVQRPEAVCSLLRSLIKEKCAKGEISTIRRIAGECVQQQPSWLQSDAIVDTVTKYASFEDQAGKLRRVCRQFNSSALRQLERKLDKVKLIGWSRHDDNTRISRHVGQQWVKASVRRGWTDDCLTSKENVVEDALWLASCRCASFCDNTGSCVGSYCNNKGNCPTAFEPPQFKGEKEKSSTLDMRWARRQLTKKGKVQLPGDSRLECSYEEKEFGIYQICNEVEKIVSEGALCDGRLPHGSIDEHLKSGYKVDGRIKAKQLVRSIFLPLANAMEVSAEGGAHKRLRLSRKDKARVGLAKTQICSNPHDTYSRMKKIYRFHTAANEEIEVCLESRTTYPGRYDN